jgi:hypothetical protein
MLLLTLQSPIVVLAAVDSAGRDIATWQRMAAAVLATSVNDTEVELAANPKLTHSATALLDLSAKPKRHPEDLRPSASSLKIHASTSRAKLACRILDSGTLCAKPNLQPDDLLPSVSSL